MLREPKSPVRHHLLILHHDAKINSVLPNNALFWETQYINTKFFQDWANHLMPNAYLLTKRVSVKLFVVGGCCLRGWLANTQRCHRPSTVCLCCVERFSRCYLTLCYHYQLTYSCNLSKPCQRSWVLPSKHKPAQNQNNLWYASGIHNV